MSRFDCEMRRRHRNVRYPGHLLLDDEDDADVIGRLESSTKRKSNILTTDTTSHYISFPHLFCTSRTRYPARQTFGHTTASCRLISNHLIPHLELYEHPVGR